MLLKEYTIKSNLLRRIIMNKKGFTLIELLVVVLIIGILSSVALPQYQKTVLKSRAAEAWSTLGTIRTAVDAYCLENPSGAGSFDGIKDSLSIEVKNSNNFTYSGSIDCSRTANKGSVIASYSKGSTSFKLGYGTGGHSVNARVCDGASCKDLGINNIGTYQCLTCGGMASTCYYID